MEKHLQRLLVHAVAVRDAAAAQQTDGADADHDAGQPPGGAELRVLLHPARLQRQEANSLHRLHVDQRLLLSQLDSTEFFFFFFTLQPAPCLLLNILGFTHFTSIKH